MSPFAMLAGFTLLIESRRLGGSGRRCAPLTAAHVTGMAGTGTGTGTGIVPHAAGIPRRRSSSLDEGGRGGGRWPARRAAAT